MFKQILCYSKFTEADYTQ